MKKLDGFINETIPDETITIDGKVYRNGFYGTLYPLFEDPEMFIDSPYAGRLEKTPVYNDGRNDYHRVNFLEHDWIQSFIGDLQGGTVYCAEDQWKETELFYKNPKNFNYFYTFHKFEPEKDIEIQPFNQASNKKIEENTIRLPEDSSKNEVILYKESKDGFFKSMKSNAFFIYNDKPYLVFYYDGGSKNNGVASVVALDVPSDWGKARFP